MTLPRSLAFALALVFFASTAQVQAQTPHDPGMPFKEDPGIQADDDGPSHGPGPNMGPRGDMKRKMKEWKQDRDPAEAEAYEKQIHQIREKSEIYLQMAKILADKKEFDKALETVRKVLTIKIPEGPLMAEMMRKKARVYLMAADIADQSGREDDAAKLIEEGLAATKEMPEVAMQLYKRSAEMLRKKGDLDGALKMLEKAAELSEMEGK